MTIPKVRTRVLATAMTMAAAGALVVPPAAHAETVYTFAEVQKHATEQDCWSIISGGVYNLTGFIPRHEGGRKVIIALCGIDGTASYLGQHGRSSGDDENEPAQALSRYRIGALDPTSVPSATKAYTAADVAAHKTASDCWSIVDGKVYDLTKWIPKHIGGPDVIIPMCGIDGTAIYNGKHKGSASAKGALDSYVIGTLSGAATAAPTTPAPTKTYTMTQVRKHNKARDCWSVVNKGVYNLTKWVNKHPGGKSVVIAMCGKKGTTLYKSQHAGDAAAASILKGYRIGRLA